MLRYKNLDGDSGIVGYEIGADFIRIQFTRGRPYRWTYTSAGPRHVENMKVLATKGDGLNAYINRHVKKLYSPHDR